ncbi:hypothetical protein SARC_09673 [Sphaeroforma arctica JP610]|uniref:Uncharacterized protein n=1 Tax=Sphaeroforma arctica JP610 TaxID=667725 RepID=A0A0L0FPI4_9EUKA|nr:hypothetical protein SARC_09673 [Sphaeroforma arctica JP610]KNC77883.1 hypothetical protein SARC_09673 [Sphaeroforma arctica JP610]|eukprot:XP_014151785.1 hypothetical protein SARC_09673 [Sphaeroforma arctica JP610]
MLNFHAKDIHNALGTDRKTWFKFVNSMIAVAVVTAIFDISDRHHNNVLLTPDNTICLIDLSASLGKKAPMDKSLDINPVYLPKRFLDLREYSNVLSEKVWHEPPSDFYAIEHAAMMAYYPLFRDPILKKAMEAVSYKMLKPHKFLALLHERKSTRQSKEGLRNDIVKAMDNSESFHKFVAGITSIVPMN